MISYYLSCVKLCVCMKTHHWKVLLLLFDSNTTSTIMKRQWISIAKRTIIYKIGFSLLLLLLVLFTIINKLIRLNYFLLHAHPFSLQFPPVVTSHPIPSYPIPSHPTLTALQPYIILLFSFRKYIYLLVGSSDQLILVVPLFILCSIGTNSSLFR